MFVLSAGCVMALLLAVQSVLRRVPIAAHPVHRPCAFACRLSQQVVARDLHEVGMLHLSASPDAIAVEAQRDMLDCFIMCCVHNITL